MSAGELIKVLAHVEYCDVAVHGGQLYAAAHRAPVIDVYDSHTWTKLRSIHTPCRDSKHNDGIYRHTLCVNDSNIKCCCLNLNGIYILDTYGTVKTSRGPDINITQPPITGAESLHSKGTSRLNWPLICQEDDDGAVLVADWCNERLLVLSEAGLWLQVRLNHQLRWPRGGMWWQRRLYVSTLEDKKLTMFE